MVNRKLTGAHYGLRDWAMQRVTAVLMVVYALFFLVFLISLFGADSYSEWQQFFSKIWVKVFTQVTFIALFLHAWVGIRDLWMDYVKPFGIRLFLHSFTIVWLLSCTVYSVFVIWGR